MADYDQIIFLRDASLEDKVAALVDGIAPVASRIAVEPYNDPADPEVQLAVFFTATSQEQLDQWVAEVRRRLTEELDLDAKAAPTADEYELVELAR